MHNLDYMREFYQPTQPTVKNKSKEILYRETLPSKVLQSYVYCFWQLKTNLKLGSAYSYRVVSDGCIDIFFNKNNLSDSAVMGFCRRYTEFSIGTEFNYIGIRFLPSAFTSLFGIDAKTLSDQSYALKLVLPAFSKWIIATLELAETFEDIAILLNIRLEEWIKISDLSLDWRFYDAMMLIFARNGYLNLETDLNTDLSARQLRRLFNFYTGTTQKVFSNVVRFQYILNVAPSKQALKEDKLYLDVGFFDQAHFIKSFKSFYGVTPSKAFH